MGVPDTLKVDEEDSVSVREDDSEALSVADVERVRVRVTGGVTDCEGVCERLVDPERVSVMDEVGDTESVTESEAVGVKEVDEEPVADALRV